jgi:hypothetical protein
MNSRLRILAVIMASALVDFQHEVYSGFSEAGASQERANVAAKRIQIAGAGEELAASSKKFNDAIDRSNDGLRREAEKAADKHAEAKKENAKWLQDHPKASDEMKKGANRAVEKLKQDALGLYDKYIKALTEAADSRAAVGGRAKKDSEDAKGKSDEHAATSRYDDAKAAYNAVNQSITAALHAKAKIQ